MVQAVTALGSKAVKTFDESCLRLYCCDGRYQLYRRRGECCLDDCVIEEDLCDCGSVVVRGGITVTQRVSVIGGNPDSVIVMRSFSLLSRCP